MTLQACKEDIEGCENSEGGDSDWQWNIHSKTI